MTTRLLPQRSRFGDIKLTGFLGSGGFSDVYAGSLPDGRQAAVKLFRSGSVDREAIKLRLQRERDIVQTLITGGVARLLESDLEAEVPWIASELINGPTLRESIQADGVMDETEALGIVQSLATTLIELHGRGVAHRDITPNNVIISSKGPVLIDFGSARADLGDGNTRSVLLEGTVGYLPPEAERGEEVGRAADVFALARIAEFCLSGSDEDNVALPEVLLQALSPDPLDRPAASAIAAALPSSVDPAKRHSPRTIESLPRRVSAALTATMSMFVLGLGLLLGFAIFSPQPSTSNSLLGANQLEGLAAVPDQMLAIDVAGLSVERLRPIETGLGASIGDLAGYRLWGLADPDRDFDRCAEGDELVCDELWLGSPVDSAYEAFGETCGGRGRIFDASCSGQAVTDIAPDFVDGAFKLVALFDADHGQGEGDPIPAEIRRRAGELFERVERERLRGDCYLEQADEPSRIGVTEMYVWVASERPGCGRNELGRKALAGVLWSAKSPIAVEWVVESTSPLSARQLLEGLSLSPSFDFVRLTGAAQYSDVVEGADARIESDRIRGFDSFFAGATVLRLAPGSSLEFSTELPTDLAFTFALVTAEPSPGLDGWRWGWIPAGTWWAREAGERRTITNPTDEEALLWVQIEQNGNNKDNVEWTVAPQVGDAAAFGIRDVFTGMFTDSRLEIQSLRSIYDQEIFRETTGDRLFLLPSDTGSTDSFDGAPATFFVSRDCKEFSLATSLLFSELRSEVDGCDVSQLLMLDDAYSWWEMSDQQADGAHFLMADAELFSVIHRTSPQAWLLTGTGVSDANAQCDSQNGAEVSGPNGLTLEIVVSLDCPISDQHHEDTSGGTDLQTAPIFRFSLRADRYEWPIYAGSFSPQSTAELGSFGSFLSEFLLEPRQ